MEEYIDKNKTLKSKYSQCEELRSNYLNRAYDASELTIPFLLPRNEKNNQDFYTPWQSVGARGVNNLASKLLITLFPPNQPFFKLEIDDFTLQEITQFIISVNLINENEFCISDIL